MIDNQESTRELENPSKRVDLVAYLREVIAMREMGQPYDIDEIFHFFFDDTDLYPRAEKEIGWFLSNSKEASLVNKLTFKLNELLNEQGDVPTRKFTNSCKWDGIVETARKILETIDS